MSQPDYIIWKIDETEEELRASLSHPEYFAAKIANLKPGSRRMLEILAVRRALKELFYGEEQEVFYDEDGRPSLAAGKPCISISHTQGYAAVITSDVSVGIDIERIGSRVERVVSHFLKPEETVTLALYAGQVPALHLAWSAKEAAYKILGRAYFDLQKLTTITGIDIAHKTLTLAVEGHDTPLLVHYDYTEEYVLTYVQL